MPVVPRAQPEVNNAPLPGVRQSVDTSAEGFGAGIGRGLQQAGQVLGAYAAQQRDRMDTTAVMQAEAELRTEQNRILFGDGQQDRGAYGTRGQESFGVPEQALPAFDKKRADLLGRLKGRQRDLFDRRTLDWRPSMEGDLLRHVAREAETFQTETQKAYIDSAASTAVLNFNDPGKVDNEIDRATGAFIVGNPGIPAEAQRVGVQAIRSSIRRMVAERLLGTSPDAAQAYLEKYREDFTGKDTVALEQAVKPALLAAKAERNVDVIRRTGGALPTGFDSVVTEIIHDVEGGAAYVSNDGGKGPTRWGINSTANPEVNVGTLDEAGARDVYRRKYWDAIGADDLPPDLQAQAMDAAVNQGVSWAKRALRESAGDPARFAELRRARYQQLARDNPGEYADDLRGWLRRVDRFEAKAGAMPAPPTLGAQLRAARDTISDPEELRATTSAITQRHTIEEADKRASEEAMTQAISTAIETSAPGTPVERVLTAAQLRYVQGEPGQLEAWRTRQRERASGTEAPSDPTYRRRIEEVVFYAAGGQGAPNQTRAQTYLQKVNPYDPHLPLSTRDREWLAKAKLDVFSADPERTQAHVTEGEVNKLIEQYRVAELGISDKKKDDPRAIAFDQAMRSWVNARADKNKPPTYDEVRQHADELVLSGAVVTPGRLWGTNETGFRVMDLGIPPETHDFLVHRLTEAGYPVTAQNLAQAYKNYRKGER